MDRAARRRVPAPWLGALAAICGGCVTLAPGSRAPSPEAIVLDHAPVRSVEDDQCGPGSLAIVLNTLGDPVTEAELAAALPRAPGGGVLSVDLMLAARARGFSTALVKGDEDALAREIEQGRPVILMLRLVNVPWRSGDVYHYVVSDGYDPRKALFRFQFGDGKVRWAELRRIEGAWEGAGWAMITVRPPPVGEQIRAAVALEQDGQLSEAAERYRRILAEDPEVAQAWLNLGNVELNRDRLGEAEQAYRRALALSPGDADALNNLAWLLLEEGSRLAEAEVLARAAADTPGADRAQTLDTLGRVLAARGQCEKADAAFATALGLPALTTGLRTQIENARREAATACRGQ